jgi:hypothetical protein
MRGDESESLDILMTSHSARKQPDLKNRAYQVSGM